MQEPNRKQYKTADEDMVAEFGRLLNLFGVALAPSSERQAFYRLMNEASAKGMTWVEGLEYVVERQALGDIRCTPSLMAKLGARFPGSLPHD